MQEMVVSAPPAVSSAKLVEFLVRLGKAVHKSTIYPPGHPAIPAAVSLFVESLHGALADRGTVTLGVARDRLMLEGETLETRSASVAWLATRLFDAGVVAVDLHVGLGEPEAIRFVQWIARPAPADGEEEELPSFEGIGLLRYNLGRVHFGEGPAADRTDRENPMRVWLALTTGLFGGADTDAHGRSVDDPEALARDLSERLAVEGAASAAVLASRVIAMGAHLTELSDPVRVAVKRRIGRFLTGLTPALRTEILRVDPRSSRQKLEFVNEMIDTLPNTAVMDVLGTIDRTGARVPHQFVTLMNKLIGLSSRDSTLRVHLAEKFEMMGLPRTIVDSGGEDMRDVLSEVLQSRIEKNWNPERYQALLEELSVRRVAGAPSYLSGKYGDPQSPESISSHVAEIALCLFVAAPEAPEAPGFVRKLDEDAPRALEAGRFEQVHEAASLLRSLSGKDKHLPPEVASLTESYLANFTKEERIERVLTAAMSQTGPLSAHLIGLFRIAGTDAGYTAFQKLIAMDEGPDSERLRELLVHLAPEDFAVVMARLRTEGWAALRCLFPVLQKIGGQRAVDLAMTFVGNEDHRVRLEALRVLLSEDEAHGQAERYIERGLFDESTPVVSFALNQARLHPSPTMTTLLASFVREDRGPREDELRVRAVSILGTYGTPEARDALIGLLSAQKVALWVKQVKITTALEETLEKLGDDASLAAVAAWRRSPARWISLFLVQGKVEA